MVDTGRFVHPNNIPPTVSVEEFDRQVKIAHSPCAQPFVCSVLLRDFMDGKLDASAVLRSGTCRHALCGTHAPSLTKEAIAAGLLTKDGKPSPTAGQFASRSLSFRVKTLVDNLALMTAKSEANAQETVTTPASKDARQGFANKLARCSKGKLQIFNKIRQRKAAYKHSTGLNGRLRCRPRLHPKKTPVKVTINAIHLHSNPKDIHQEKSTRTDTPDAWYQDNITGI